MASSTGLSYFQCDFAENIADIDITYAVQMVSPFKSHLSSNPARFVDPLFINSTTITCDGVTEMLDRGLEIYVPYLDAQQ